MMFSATRVAALVAVLTVGGSLVLVTGPLSPGSDTYGGPAAEAAGPEAAATFSGSGRISVLDTGTETTADGVGHLQGHISAMEAEWVEVTDPRVEGTQTWIQDAANYGGFGPAWGPFRIENDDGAWVGEVSGAWDGTWTGFTGWLTGEDAYEGLVLYYSFDAGPGMDGTFRGVIYPANAPPIELEVE